MTCKFTFRKTHVEPSQSSATGMTNQNSDSLQLHWLVGKDVLAWWAFCVAWLLPRFVVASHWSGDCSSDQQAVFCLQHVEKNQPWRYEYMFCCSLIHIASWKASVRQRRCRMKRGRVSVLQCMQGLLVWHHSSTDLPTKKAQILWPDQQCWQHVWPCGAGSLQWAPVHATMRRKLGGATGELHVVAAQTLESQRTSAWQHVHVKVVHYHGLLACWLIKPHQQWGHSYSLLINLGWGVEPCGIVSGMCRMMIVTNLQMRLTLKMKPSCQT